VTEVLGVRHALNLRAVPTAREGNTQVVEGCATAEDQSAVYRVHTGEVPVAVGMEVHGVVTHAPSPWLGVQDRGRPQRILDRCSDVRLPVHSRLP
jgi:hypothetical protein